MDVGRGKVVMIQDSGSLTVRVRACACARVHMCAHKISVCGCVWEWVCVREFVVVGEDNIKAFCIMCSHMCLLT